MFTNVKGTQYGIDENAIMLVLEVPPPPSICNFILYKLTSRFISSSVLVFNIVSLQLIQNFHVKFLKYLFFFVVIVQNINILHLCTYFFSYLNLFIFFFFFWLLLFMNIGHIPQWVFFCCCCFLYNILCFKVLSVTTNVESHVFALFLSSEFFNA